MPVNGYAGLVAGYLALVNLIGFGAMGADKRRAKKHQWRIPERRLFLIAFLFGSFGVWMGMYAFRHKTRHWYFVVGIPVILIAQITGIFVLYLRFGAIF